MPRNQTEVLPKTVFWDYDIASQTTLWSPGIHCLLRGGGMNLVGKRDVLLARVHPADVTRVVEAFSEVLNGKAARFDVRYRIQADDGHFVDVRDRAFAVSENNSTKRIVGVLDEIGGEVPGETAHISRARDLSAAQLETFIDSLPLLCWEADPNGWIYFYNRRWYEYTGTTPEQMEGWGWIAVHDETDLPRMLKVWRQALSTGTAWEDEFRLRGRDGKFRWFLSRATPFRDQANNVIRWFGSNVDIHDQKLALAERERLFRHEQQLRAAAEATNREKDEFLAIVSHELRSPLAVIIGWGALLDKLSDSPERVREAADKIQNNAKLQSRLIEDLLDMSRIIAGKLELQREPVDLAHTVQNAVEAATGSAQEKNL